MRIGNAPVSWGVFEVESGGAQLPWPRVLDEIASAGYEGTELGPWGYLPGQPDRPLKVGDSYQIPAGAPHDARSGPEGAKVIATYVVEKGKPLASPAD